MFKEGKAYVLPLLMGCLILGCFHLCLAHYFFQTEADFATIPPLQRHLPTLQLNPAPSRLTPHYHNPFFATLPEAQAKGESAPAQQSLRLAGIITKGKQHYALIEYGGMNQLYGVGDHLGPYKLQAINSQQVILQGEQEEICLAMEKRP